MQGYLRFPSHAILKNVSINYALCEYFYFLALSALRAARIDKLIAYLLKMRSDIESSRALFFVALFCAETANFDNGPQATSPPPPAPVLSKFTANRLRCHNTYARMWSE